MKAIVRALWGVLGAVCVSVVAADAPTDARIDAMAAATAHAAGGGPVITARFFGQHLHRLVLREGEQAVRTAWPAVAVGRLRLWDSSTRWGDVAPAPGRWNFDRLDAYVQAAHDHGAEVLYTLGSTPRWASSRPDEPCSYGFGCSAEPARMSDWADYVRMVARRYRGRIHAYELWNEPHFSDIERDRHAPPNHSGFYTGSIATMVQMARIAREVLDAEDPQAVLATPGFVNGPDRLEMFLAAGGSRYVQAVAYHLYASSDAQFARQLVELRALMRRQGVAHLPLWSTEAGVEVYAEHEALPQGMRRIDPAQASALRAQVLLLAAAGGVQRYDYYAWDNDRSGLVDRRGVARSGAAAFRRVQGWLIGTRMSGCRSMPNRGVRCEGQRDGQHLVFVWSEQPATLQTLQWERPAGWALAAVETLDGAEDVVVSQTPTSLVVSRLSSAPVMLRLTP